MNSYLNEYTHEYWRGNEDCSKAPDYVFTKPAGGGAPFLLYYGRIGGVNFSEIEAMKNQKALKELHDDIISEVFSPKYLSEIGKKGGEKTSPQKKKSSSENGKKGGRPRYRIFCDRGNGKLEDDGCWGGENNAVAKKAEAIESAVFLEGQYPDCEWVVMDEILNKEIYRTEK